MKALAFQTRARAIDHLGRGQIADAPTAVSELWKNAYDAYARAVSLQLFDGTPSVAAILDDGVGMSRDEFVDRWLVIGTDSKVGGDPEHAETLGLPRRPKQGEKGIGRLSVAFLAPVTILLSKKTGHPLAGLLVDWRLFENPFIALDDVLLPVDAFGEAADVMGRLAAMGAQMGVNLGDGDGERAARLRAGWDRFDRHERSQGVIETTSQRIRATWASLPLDERHLDEWPVHLGLAEHGTALFMAEVNHELEVWIQEGRREEEARQARSRLTETLTGFTDPFSDDRSLFEYEVRLHLGRKQRAVLSSDDVFGVEDLRALEHHVEGSFDADGIFTGRVVAFGQDLGIKRYAPRTPPPRTGKDRIGPFEFSIGTFEQEGRRTTHTEADLARLSDQAERYGGVYVYRDELRVMPYGRANADFFGIEERRSRHAGREFWSYRRSFGRVALTREGNPNLKDKAGREGFVENRTKRELQMLVAGLLMDFARRFFGTDSDYRADLLPGIIAANAAARQAAQKSSNKRRKGLRQFVKEMAPKLDEALARVDGLIAEAGRAKATRDMAMVTVSAAKYRDLVRARSELRPPPVSSNLADLEEPYRKYRDGYLDLADRLATLGNSVADLQADVGELDPDAVVSASFEEQRKALDERLSAYVSTIHARLAELGAKWSDQARLDAAAYGRIGSPLLQDAVSPAALVRVLNLLDAYRLEQEEAAAGRYAPLIRALDQLIDDIDLDGALAVVDDDRSRLEDRVRNLNAVAQVGITVEIIGHELQDLDGQVRRNLMALPEGARATQQFKDAFEAHAALTDRLRFLAPIKVAGYRSRIPIHGGEIADYVRDFFGRAMAQSRIEFHATPAFRGLRITDLPSRIFPVFINLVNNAIYWVSHSDDRRIVLDLIGAMVVVADSGPGVDPDDVPRLFELFFTQRQAGRGVGLYLCRVNLAVAHHGIRYAARDDPKVLPGANFIIEFRGLSTNA